MRLLITACILMISLDLVAQNEKPINRGNILMGGSIYGGYSFSKQDDESYNDIHFTLNPSVGYFIIDGLAIGIILSINYSKSFGEVEYSYSYIGLETFIKYYFRNGLFINGNTGITFNFREITDYRGYQFQLRPGVGYAFFVNSKISIEPSVNYQFIFFHNDFTADARGNELYFSIGFKMFL